MKGIELFLMDIVIRKGFFVTTSQGQVGRVILLVYNG